MALNAHGMDAQSILHAAQASINSDGLVDCQRRP
jgi:hypothetical protein